MRKLLFMLAALALAGQAAAGEGRTVDAKTGDDSDWPTAENYPAHAPFLDGLKIGLDEILELNAHPLIEDRMLAYVRSTDTSTKTQGDFDPVADYETYVPHKTQPDISHFERTILTGYLDDVSDTGLTRFLALYHLNRSLLRNAGGEAVAHTIIARYFLHRTVALGDDSDWVKTALRKTQRRIKALVAGGTARDDAAADAEENHAAHRYFRRSFFGNHEERRYIAVNKLLDDFANHPNNMLTNTYLTTANIWVGGEADYDDPTILYSFVLSSYFSVRARYLAERTEERWRADPVHAKRFRLATLIGGWTVPARRWLAKLHGDQEAVALLDAEHREWLDINVAFTSVPVGLMLFEEQQNFAEGFAAWEAGRTYCDQVDPRDLSCINWPRASFNILSFVLGEVDFFLKAGLLEQARALLSLRFLPLDIFADSFANWDLGRDAWLHRENNLERIAELYANDDPEDDPSHFLLKQHKWGPGTFQCQVCHTRQSKEWPRGEVKRVLASTSEIPPIGRGNWPRVSTTWYGALKGTAR